MGSGLKESYNDKEHEDYYGTNECAHNSYTPQSMKENDPKGKRIDYILYRASSDHQVKQINNITFDLFRSNHFVLLTPFAG